MSAFLERLVPFDGLPTKARAELVDDIVIRHYKAGEIILEQGQTDHPFLYLVKKGKVELAEKGARGVTRTPGQGKVFGQYGLLYKGALPYQAQAVEETDCALIPAERFYQLCTDYPVFEAYFRSDVQGYTRHYLAFYDVTGARLLFGTHLRDLVHQAPLFCEPTATVRRVAEQMRQVRTDNAIVMRDGEPIGILSDRDLRNQIVAQGASTDTPVAQVMCPDVLILPGYENVFGALMAAMQREASHILVRQGSGPNTHYSGVITDRDIVQSHGYSPALLLERIARMTTPAQLAELRQDTTRHLLRLYQRGVRSQDLILINTTFNDRLTVRTLELVETSLRDSYPDLYTNVNWAWMSLGSEGRGEMALKTDQDNALVYVEPINEQEKQRVEHWLTLLTEQANLTLAEVGLALCEANIMARNPLWRHPLDQWQHSFEQWILNPEPEEIMQIAAACDLRGVYGDRQLVETIKEAIKATLDRAPRFLFHMARSALFLTPPLSRFPRRIKTHKEGGRQVFNIKRRGLQPITDIARLLALQVRFLDSSNTFDRLDYVREALPDLDYVIKEAQEAYRYLNDVRLGQHLNAIERGETPENLIPPADLSETQREMLVAAFTAIEGIQNAMTRRFGVLRNF